MNLTSRQIHETARPFEAWKQGPFSHLTRLAIPYPSVGQGFKFAANGHLFDGLLSVKVYCDSLTGISGNNLDDDPIVADLVTSGWLTFLGNGGTHPVTPGQICIRDTKTPWKFACGPATRLRVITIPRRLLISRIESPKVLNQAYIQDVTSPEVRFLVNFLEALEKSSADLDRSLAAQNIALDACATLLSGMLSGRSRVGSDDHRNATVEAAKNAIERNIDRHDLSPAMIAQIVGVSLRTLHRSFSASDDSIMAFARRRRLQRAHDDLMRLGSAAGISEIAARWHFSDASHFIRSFKSAYGITPAAYLRNAGTAAGRSAADRDSSSA